MKTQNHNQIFPEVRYHPSIQTHKPRDTFTHTDTHTDTHTPRDTHTFTHTAPATSKTTKKQTHTHTFTSPAALSKTSQNQSKQLIIPKVRYHPTITSQSPDEREPAKPNPARTQRSRPSQTGDKPSGPPSPPHTGPKLTHTDPPLAGKSPPDNGGDRQRTSDRNKWTTDPDLHKAARGSSHSTKPKPEDFPLGLGVTLDRHTVDRVEILTRGQSTNPDWFSWRTNRITASVAHRIAQSRFANGKSQTPPTSYMAAITGEGPRVQTRAMSWGNDMEAEAVRSYQKLKSSQLGSPVSVRECGLFIDPSRPWLAGSPDGLVTDRQTGERLLCLEVKCPFKHRHHTVEDACRQDRQFCLEIYNEDGRKPGEPPAYRLKTSHSYYTQIQVQLAVTGLQNADLAVYTPSETAIVPVTFDPERWSETVCKLETFYREAVLPIIRQTGLPREM